MGKQVSYKNSFPSSYVFSTLFLLKSCRHKKNICIVLESWQSQPRPWENWVNKQSFFVFRNKTFCFSRNFKVQIEMEFCENLQNFNSIREPTKKDEKLNELKFCEVSRILISNWTWKFQLSILKNKKVLFLKRMFFKAYRQDTSKRWR